MRTICVIPLEPEPIFMLECPHGTQLGRVHLRWTELKLVKCANPRDTDAELHSSCALGVTCATFCVNRDELLRAVAVVRAGRQPDPIATSDGQQLELQFLDLRKAPPARSRLRAYHPRVAAVA